MQQSLKKQKMTEGNLFPNLIVYAVPIILSGVLQLLYNAADLIVCGQYGSDHATAAISSTNSLVHLIVNLFLGLSVGANVLMARCYGAKDQEKGQKVVYTAMIFSIISGVILAIIGSTMSHTFLEWMGSPEDVIELSTSYLFIYFLGIPFSMIYNFGAAIFRATGDTKRPFIFLAVSGVFNVLLNLLFVIVFQMDVPGVALATVLSQAMAAGAIVVSLCMSHDFFHFKWSELHFYKDEALEILRIGLPAGLQSVIFSFSNVLIQSSINSLGTNVMDGNGASSSLEGFVYTSMNGVAQATVAFVSANYGAKKRENIKKSIYYSLILVVAMNLIVGGTILIFRSALLKLYINNEEALEAANSRLLIIVGTYFLCGVMDVGAYSLRGIGYSLVPTIVSLIGSCALRIVWILTFWQLPALHNLAGLVVSYPISWIITLSVHYLLFIILFKKVRFEEPIQA